MPIWRRGPPLRSPERSRGRLEVSRGASKPALGRPHNGDVRVFNQVAITTHFPIKHGHFPINPGRFPISPGHFLINAGRFQPGDDGIEPLSASSLLQMAGRAGRRGQDDLGHVVLCRSAFEGATEAHALLQRPPDAISSRFCVSYGSALKLRWAALHCHITIY